MAQIIDLNYFSVGFPNKNWNKLIERENFLESISTEFQNGKKIVFLSGEEGTGKSTLLAQFCRKNIKNTLSVFFNPFHTLDLNLDFLRANLTAQINFILNPTIADSEADDYVSPEKYRMALLNLKKKYRNSKEQIIIIIDGLENRSNLEEEIIKNIFKELPFGEEYINFIISGSQKIYKNVFKEIETFENQEINIVGFSNYQIENYLNKYPKIVLNHPELIKLTKGYPGRLEVLKSLLDQGYEIQQIPNTNNFKSWIDLDTEKIDLNDKNINLILSLITLGNQNFSFKELGDITGNCEDDILLIVNKIHILEDLNGAIQFISEQYSQYYKSLLKFNKRKIEELLVKYYVASDTVSAKFELSKIYQAQKKWSKIIDLIDESYLKGTIQSTGSIDKVNESVHLGFISAEQLNHSSKIYRYCFHGSIINELDNYLFWESEIMARISLKDFAGAINLAEKAVLKVDRLRLLSLIAKNEKQINNLVDQELVMLIQDLYKTTNLAGIGNSIYDIVSNLIYAVPNIAIEMIEKTSGSVSESNINDWIVAKLSIAAITSSNGEKDTDEKDKKFKALEKLNNPSVRKIQRAISLMVGNYSSSKVLEEVRKLNDSNEKLKLLRLWLKNNKSHKQKLTSVLEATFDELILFTSDSNAILDTLVDLSNQLHNVRDKKEAEKLLTRFKSFDENIHGLGLGRDYYIYQLNIFHSWYYLDLAKAEHRLEDIINNVSTIEDSLIRLESYSEVFYKLSIIRNRRFIPYYNKVYGRIKYEIETLLNNTANHFKITENILSTIGRVNVKFSIEISNLINTSYTRDRARLKILDAYLDNSLKFILRENLEMLISSFETEIFVEIGIQNILERFTIAKSLPYDKVKGVLHFIDKIKNFTHNSRQLECHILSYQLISKNSKWLQKLNNSYKKAIENSWSKIESDWAKIDNGFIISSETSKIDQEFAQNIFEQTLLMKDQSWLDSSSVAKTYISSLRLVTKAYAALIKNSADTKKDFILYQSLLDRIPSEIEKLLLWTELAINAIISENFNIVKSIYDNHIMPLIISIIEKDKGINKVLESFVVIHYHNSELAIEYLNLLSEFNKENACLRISDFYINHKNPFEYYDGEFNSSKTSYDDLFKAIKLLNELNTDNLLYIQITDITKAISNSNSISRQQKSELKNRIKEIAQAKLPDQKNIKHEGYKILVEVQLQLIDRDNSQSWDSFIQQANGINNTSDRLFVKGNLLEELPFAKITNGKDLKKILVQDIFSDLEALTSHYEFVEKVVYLSKMMYEITRTKWQEVVNKAFDISFEFEEGIERYDYQKDILDTMYRIDENFAKTLINTSKSNKSENNNKLLKDYYETLELSKKIKNNQSLEDLKKESYRNIISAIARAQGSLNSGKITTKRISDVAKYLEIGKNLPLSECFPVFEYFLSNSANLKLNKNQKSEMIDIQRDTYEYMIKALKLIEILSFKRKAEHSINKKVLIDKDFIENLAVKPNSREEAINFIREWILEEAEDFIIIADPYLKKQDVEILKFIIESKKEMDISFLGCENAISYDIQDQYLKYWDKISHEDPPFSKFIFCWIPEDQSKKPIHDRWIISKNGGLRLGTSYNGLGVSRESEISIMKPNEALNILENTLVGYIENKTRFINNQKLKYFSFTL